MENKDIRWSSKISVGIPEIDRQHKIFYRLVNHLIKIGSEEISREEIVKHIKNTRIFAVKHFRAEEKVMEDYNYTFYQEHKKKHRDILELLMDYALKAERGEVDQETLNQFSYTLIDWFAKQTLDDDIKLANFLKNDIGLGRKLYDKLKGYFSKY